MSLENIFKPSSRDVPPSNDGSAVDFSKLVMNAMKKEGNLCLIPSLFYSI